MAERRFCIGYALAPKKQQSFIQDSLLGLAASRGIDLVRIDTDWPLLDQGPFDCVLHKFYGEAWRRELVEFGVQNPMAFVLDSPDSIDRLRNRISMLQVVSELKIDNADESFGIPNQIVIYDRENLLDRQTWEGLEFPVIAKPLVADGSATSHKMALVFNHECLNKLKPPIVLQEFVNHGEVIFKVFVVGKYVRCVKRKSLPDEPELTLGNVEGLLSFSQVSNMTTTWEDEYDRMMQLDDTEMPPLSFLTDIARELRQSLNLNLFNFDMIRDSRIGTRYLIIDINYFPGYSKMPGYEEVLTDFFCDLAQMRNEMENNPDELDHRIGMLAIDQPGPVQSHDQETGTIAIDQPRAVQSDEQETGSSAVAEEDDQSGTTLNDEDEDDDLSDEREVKVTPVDDDDWP